MGGIAQSIGGLFGAGGQGGSYTAAPITQQNLAPQLQQSTGNVNQLYGQQQNLASQLQQQMMGQGPNLANALLQQANNQNMAQAAGLTASQQGINPAMAARAAGQQAGQLGQQAGAQASVNQMQQQLAAQQQLGGLYGQMGGQQLQQQSIDQNALAAQNNAINQNSSINAGMAQANMQNQGKAMAGLLGGAATVLSGGALPAAAAATGAGSGAGGTLLNNFFSGSNPYAQNKAMGGEMSVPEHLKGMAEHLGYGGQLAASGGKVKAHGPDQKAVVKGDSLKNDKVPTMLTEGEHVTKRSIAQIPEVKQLLETINNSTPEQAASLAAKLKGGKESKSKGGEEDDFKSALKRGMKERK